MSKKKQFHPVRNGLIVRAPAKLNLSLLIAGKRPDGFHEIETTMAKVDFFDELEITPADRPGIHLRCTGSQWAPMDSDNLVYQAAEAVFRHCGMSPRVDMTLRKHIPAGTGLGSASSDAAAALLGLNRLFRLGLSTETLADIASGLGSDVTFFLYGPQSFCQGKGEKITPLSTFYEFTAFVVIPNLTVSTKSIYKAYRHKPDIYRRLHQDINGYLNKNRVDFMAKTCINMLSETCFSLNRGLAELKERIESLGIKPLCLSGSGAALFCILVDRETFSHVHRVQQQLRQDMKCDSLIVHSLKW